MRWILPVRPISCSALVSSQRQNPPWYSVILLCGQTGLCWQLFCCYVWSCLGHVCKTLLSFILPCSRQGPQVVFWTHQRRPREMEVNVFISSLTQQMECFPNLLDFMYPIRKRTRRKHLGIEGPFKTLESSRTNLRFLSSRSTRGFL